MGGVRFKRVAEAFDMAAAARGSRDIICSESSGSEQQSAESFTDLSDLVNSFLERETSSSSSSSSGEEIIIDDDSKEYEEDNECTSLRGILQGLDDMELKLEAQVESACRDLDRFSPDFKRQLMITLRQRGFDAGLCKSKWSKTVNLHPGNYEYVDVNVAGSRYIVEVFIAGEFEVGRSTERYASLIQILPPIFVGKTQVLKQIIRLMCRAMKNCMKKHGMHVPPWRRYAYMQAKWFGSNYRRTINQLSANKAPDDKSTNKRAVGFVPINPSYFCRQDCVTKIGSTRVGNLAMVMNDSGLLI